MRRWDTGLWDKGASMRGVVGLSSGTCSRRRGWVADVSGTGASDTDASDPGVLCTGALCTSVSVMVDLSSGILILCSSLLAYYSSAMRV